MTDCKNCNYTDEYCASGECTSQSPRNHLANTSQVSDLTEQMRKGELPSGWYYLKVDEELANCPVISECVDDYNLGLPLSYFYDFDVAKIEQVLAEVPDYVEWRNMVNCACEEHEANKRLIEENAQLKEQINKYCLDAINRGTANAVKAVKEFGMPERIKELVEQNAQLKELLKEIRQQITTQVFGSPKIQLFEGTFDNKLLAKIDEVLK